MLKKIILGLSLLVSTSIIAQEKSNINKIKNRSIPSIELGIGYLFNPIDKNNFVKYQIASRNILLNKRLGFLYTIEIENDNNNIYDVFGLNYRINNNFSLQAGSGLITNNVFNSDKSIRKEISIAYHPNYMPLTFTGGFSTSMGPSLTVNYSISLKNKKANKEVRLENIQKDFKKKNNTENVINKPKDIKPTSIVKNNKETQIIKKESTKTISNNNLENINKPIKDKSIQQSTKNINSNLENKNNPIKNKVIKKEITKPAININKLCDESEILYPLNKYEISNLEKKNLQKLSSYLKENLNAKLKIFGSTDKSGSEEYNLKLSAKRANSSKNYLIKLGVSLKQLETIALGESKSQNANSEQERIKARSTTFEITTL